MTRFLLAVFLGVPLSSCVTAKPLAPSIEPAQSMVFVSSREVRALGWDGKTLWAATSGGVLRFQNSKWTRWTRANGLPTNETLGVENNGTVRLPVATARFEGGKWVAQSAPPFQKAELVTQWRGQKVSASLDGLNYNGKPYALPSSSTGTHISALLGRKDSLEVAVYGDGLYRFDGIKWEREKENVPAQAGEITALAGDEQTTWVGTRRAGIWRGQKGKWTQFVQNDEPPAHNVQFLARFRGAVWASTLDDGLIYRSGSRWEQVAPPTLSSSAPRQSFVWHDTLYVRHGTGIVDSFDGASWTKNALKSIPRPGVYALGGDDKRLIATGWGGFAEWDGTAWIVHYDLPELKGVPVLGVFVDGEDVWLQTQSRGAGIWNRKTNTFKWSDERAGLPDDWVTTMGKFGGKIYAGTFVGGLARLDGEKWFVFPELKGENVTALCESKTGGVLAATRHGVWEVQGDTAKKLDLSWLDSEDQALLSDASGVWIGARTSLNFWRSVPVEKAETTSSEKPHPSATKTN